MPSDPMNRTRVKDVNRARDATAGRKVCGVEPLPASGALALFGPARSWLSVSVSFRLASVPGTLIKKIGARYCGLAFYCLFYHNRDPSVEVAQSPMLSRTDGGSVGSAKNHRRAVAPTKRPSVVLRHNACTARSGQNPNRVSRVGRGTSPTKQGNPDKRVRNQGPHARIESRRTVGPRGACPAAMRTSEKEGCSRRFFSRSRFRNDAGG